MCPFYKLTCEECGKPFEDENPARLFCSEKCELWDAAWTAAIAHAKEKGYDHWIEEAYANGFFQGAQHVIKKGQ